ncbi:MAG: ABC transporter ATP-binding protein/permease [Clostridia bacterium]|nr:ABC transporter ATP-binding protein/permease [Clostridia bacterium]
MLKLLKYFKPFVLSVIAIVGLLFFQATCDLALPDYMSNIVNKGIQQNGIENAAPEVIRQSELNKVSFFLSDADKTEVTKHYKLLDKASLSQSDYDKYVKDYPVLSKEPVYKLDTKDKDVINKLSDIMSKPMLLVSGIEEKGLEAFAGKGGFDMSRVPAGTDPFKVLSMVPADKKADMFKKMDEGFSKMPGTIINQGAINYVKKEYEAIGINTGAIQRRYIIHSGLMMLLIALGSMVATVTVGFLSAKVAGGLGRNLRKNMFARVESFSSTEFDKFSTASLITRSTNDIQQIQMAMVMLLRMVFYAPILGVGGFIKVLATDTNMGWIIGVAVLGILSVVLILFAVALPKFKLVQKLVDKLNLVTRESLVGMLVIRAFNTQKYEEEKFEKANREYTRTNLFISRTMWLMMPIMFLIMNTISLLIVWVGAHQVDTGSMQVGNIMAFIQYTMQIIFSFLMITMVSIMLPRASVAAQRVVEVINTKPSIKDPEKPEHFSSWTRGKVEFKNVSFRYPGAEDDALKNITFTAEPGKTTAFIGSTGAGKSTLVNLIPRFYDVTGGEIVVDGVDIRKVTQHDLRAKIGYVPQKSSLFSGTIASNLKYGDENLSFENMAKSAEIAQASGFINEMPEKYDAPISQGGTNVSGGQKQRLSIARALAKKADIYIFDDSFSALDFKTDAALRKALKAEVGDSTLLIVAQRINTIMTADQIIVLDDGEIVGMGTHKELLGSCEVYKEIAMSQLSKEELVS